MSIIDMGHVVNDVYTSWDDVYIDMRVCRDDPIPMSYDVYIDMEVCRDDPEAMSYDVYIDILHVVNDVYDV